MTFREPAQKPPDEQRPLAIDPRSMSTLEAYYYYYYFKKVEIRIFWYF
jgi:hypothetical protein